MATQAERIAAVEENTKNIEKKLDTLIDKFDGLDNRYPTRREFAAANWVIGIFLTGIGLYLAIKGS